MAAVGTAPMLPDDVILDILSRVAHGAVAALFRCAVTCKSWRALVSDPCFLRRCWPEGIRHPSSFLGVFRRSTYTYGGGWISLPPTFVSTTPSPLGPSHAFPASFDPCTVHDTEPLASRQGLLLVLLPQKRLQLAVCDMFAGTCDMLPVPNCGYVSVGGSAILTDADYCPNNQEKPQLSSNFKVLLLVRVYESHRLYSFSSAASSWKSFDLTERSFFHSDLVVCGGQVHCFFDDSWNLYRFDLCNETSHGRLTKLSSLRGRFNANRFAPPCLIATIHGKLSLLRLHTECLVLEIWTHQGEKESGGDGAADWLRTKVIELKPKTMPHIRQVSGMRMGDRTGTLLVTDQTKPIYSVNLDTCTVDDVSSLFCSQGSDKDVPFEIDWPAFFASRLERQSGS